MIVDMPLRADLMVERCIGVAVVRMRARVGVMGAGWLVVCFGFGCVRARMVMGGD